MLQRLLPLSLMGLTFFSLKRGFINCLFGQNMPCMLFRDEKNQELLENKNAS